jgi:hypothetical protein
VININSRWLELKNVPTRITGTRRAQSPLRTGRYRKLKYARNATVSILFGNDELLNSGHIVSTTSLKLLVAENGGGRRIKELVASSNCVGKGHCCVEEE